MVRWTPGARERLQAAAFDAFTARGFDGTTVADIATAAGLTERTFFRYFTDKKEVLFSGQDQFRAAFTDSAREAPNSLSSSEVIRHVLRTVATTFFPDARRTFAVARNAIVAADPALVERESLKLRNVAADLAEVMHMRGSPNVQAAIAGQTCMLVFQLAFAQWITDGEERPLDAIITVVIDEVAAVTSPAG